MRSALRYVVGVVGARGVIACGVAFVGVSAMTPPAFASALGGGPWSRPVGGPVTRAFDPPRTPFGPGHLGVDFATAPATPVRAAGDGVVVFAGRVGTGLHVVIRHPGDIRTSYSFLATTRVVAGQGVARGAIVGTSGGTGPAHAAGVVHFGVRVGATYVDPMLLFTPVDLAAVVHLATPEGGAAAAGRGAAEVQPPGGERAALVDAIRVDARAASPPPAWWHDARASVAAAGSGLRPTTPYRRRSAASAPRTHAPTRDASSSAVSPAAAVAVTGVSIAGVAAARRRRRSRRSRRW